MLGCTNEDAVSCDKHCVSKILVSGGFLALPYVITVIFNTVMAITLPHSNTSLFANKIGAVGKAIGDVQVRFDSDKEILVKSDKVFSHYFENQESTEKVFTEDGYFRTGDIGELDEQGYLKITDRKKDLIKTAGGKFVAPQKIQNLFATEPLVGHIHVHGDKEKYIVALLTLEKDQVLKLKNKFEIGSTDYKEILENNKIKAEIRQCVAKVNSQLASFETIKRFQVLDHEFTIEDGQLTPSLKMKRKIIDEMYSKEIKALYN